MTDQSQAILNPPTSNVGEWSLGVLLSDYYKVGVLGCVVETRRGEICEGHDVVTNTQPPRA